MPGTGEGRGASGHDRTVGDAPRVLSWERGRLRRTMPEMVQRCMDYATTAELDESLAEAARSFYGLELDPETIEEEILDDPDERIRFFPWYLWDWRPEPGAATVGERFLAEAELDAHERRVARALCASHLGFYEALEDASETGVDVRDVLTGERLRIADDGLRDELLSGQVLQARLVRVATADGPCVLVDAVYAVMPAEAVGMLDEELVELPREPAEAAVALQQRTPSLLELAGQLLERLARPPVARDRDGEPLLLRRSEMTGPAAERLVVAIGDGGEDLEPVAEGLWRWWHEDRPRGLVRWVAPDRVVFGATEPGALDALEARAAALAEAEPPRLRSLAELSRQAEAWAVEGGGEMWWRALPEVMEAFDRWLSSWLRQWPDRPLAELGERTPREAVQVPEGRSRVEAILERLERLRCEDRPGGAPEVDLEWLRRELRLD